YLSSSSISLATLTPSFVTVGAPHFLSSTTLRPFGPSVAFTALLSFVTPASTPRRASSPNSSCFAMLQHPSYVGWEPELLDDGQHVVFAHDEVFDAVDLHFRAGILAHQNAIARLQLQRRALAVFIHLARSDRDDFAFLGLFLGRVGDDDAAPDGFAWLFALDQNPVCQRTYFHGLSPLYFFGNSIPLS